MAFASNPLPGSIVFGQAVDHDIVLFDDFYEVSFGSSARVDVAGTSLTAVFGKFCATSNNGSWFVSTSGATSASSITGVGTSVFGVGGVARFQASSAAGAYISAQPCATPFQVRNGKDLYFEARFKVTSTSSTFLLGLFERNLDPNAGTSNGFGFKNSAATGDVIFRTERDDTATSTDTGIDLASSTYVTVAAHLSYGSSATARLRAYVNGSEKINTTTNIPATSSMLCPTLCVEDPAGVTGGTHRLDVDYILVAQKR